MTTQLTTAPSVPATALTFDNVFSYPEYTLCGIRTWEDVAKLGNKNIAALISSARSHEKSLTNDVKTIKAKQELLRGKSGDDFVEMAKEFENPTITDIGVPEDSWSKDPEPRDAASINRKSDATTFNMCGWCKHAGGGGCRYQYHITTSCNLLGNSLETKFNTPCLLQSKSADEIASEVDRMEREVENLLSRRERVREGIKLLQKLKKGAPDKPYLMSLRPHNHFNVGDEIIVYVGQCGDEGEHKSLVKDGVWVSAIVVFGYRHHEGCVSYQSLFPIHSNMSNFEGRGGGAGGSRPEVMLLSDFNYLTWAADTSADECDLGFLGLWIANIDDHLEGFDRVEFLKHLTNKPELATPPVDWAPPTDEIAVKSVKDAERVLQCLNSDFFKTEQEIKKYAAMQLRHVHPDRLNGANENVKSYAARQTRAVYAARDLLIARLKGKKK